MDPLNLKVKVTFIQEFQACAVFLGKIVLMPGHFVHPKVQIRGGGGGGRVRAQGYMEKLFMLGL